MEDEGAGKEDRAKPAYMAKPLHGWAPKEGGHNSSNMVATAADMTEDAAADIAADAADNKEMEAATVVAGGFN